MVQFLAIAAEVPFNQWSSVRVLNKENSKKVATCLIPSKFESIKHFFGPGLCSLQFCCNEAGFPFLLIRYLVCSANVWIDENDPKDYRAIILVFHFSYYTCLIVATLTPPLCPLMSLEAGFPL